jgi:uncharacterized caspase-like protein
MANYWVITIGINQYRHFQPLMHAQNDALFSHRFFTEEAGISAEHCVLLSDLATSVAQQVVYPDKPAIATWLQTITQQIQADDVLWFFFSGYGAQTHTSAGQHSGQNADYLMPIDGDPGQIEETGIAIADLIDTLAELPTNKTLLVLDINRSQGALAGQAIGTQVIDLAQKRQVATLLSCQPEQYSHETLGVRHGLFTAALLEALQQHCKTPSQISDYLSKRLPELCEHHWRPIQNPVSILPEYLALADVVPDLKAVDAVGAVRSLEIAEPNESAKFSDVSDFTLASEPTEPTEFTEASDAAEVTANAFAIEPPSMQSSDTSESGISEYSESESGISEYSEYEEISSPDIYRNRASVTPSGDYAGDLNAGGYASDLNETSEQKLSPAASASSRSNNSSRSNIDGEASDLAPAIGGAKLRNWGLVALALLMGGVILKQPFVTTAWEGLFDRVQPTSNRQDAGKLGESDKGGSGSASGGEAAGVAAVTGAQGVNKNDASKAATVPSKASSPDATATKTADSAAATAKSAETQDAEAQNAEAKNASKNNAATAEEKAAAQTLIAQANAALSQKQYSEALIALQQVPRSQRDEKFSSVLTQARAGAAAAQQANASVLTEARTAIQPTQASQFTEAIAKARLIKPGEPFYEAAQEDIRSWSQVILDIAEGRATSGSLESAIAAAKVMPFDNAEYHQKAQDRIAFWQQRQQSRKIIAEAQKIPKLGEASTYQQGIVKLREVPIEHPEYEAAQRIADQWSESIFSIAQARAAQGRESAAIQAAVLVPAGTTAYEPTQQAIRRWRAASGE